jgi:hypothetical protein
MSTHALAAATTVLVLCPGCGREGTVAEVVAHWQATLCLSGAAPACPHAVYMAGGNLSRVWPDRMSPPS